MYSTCLFCNKPLGTNEVLESFPVGRRLAFDGAKGRLWVVCRSCERWNLSPLEERWEVIEACERLFRGTKLRTSTENIGLARISGGLDLVRIGDPLRPELAAWRYGDQFGRRRQKMLLRAGLAVGALVLLNVGGAVAGIAIGGLGGFYGTIGQRIIVGDPNAVVARLRLSDGRIVPVKRRRLRSVALLEAPGGALALQLPQGRRDKFIVSGQDAQESMKILLPAINHAGAGKRHVQEAVGLLEKTPDPAAFAAYAARHATQTRARNMRALPYAMRLGLEMATHEEAERRALQGELAVLEQAWKQADELAAISDNLLLPESVDQKLESLKRANG